MKAKEKNFEDIKLGESVSFERTVSDSDLTKFADLSGDYNPLHIDSDYAASTEFNGRVVYGMFLGALVGRLVGMELPGKKALLLKECLEFKSPARIGDDLLVKGEVVHKSQFSQLIELRIEISRGKEILVVGSACVKILKNKK